jgi:hypothetical protein
MAEVEHLAATAVALVLGHDRELGAQAAEDRRVVDRAALADVVPERPAGDQGRLDDLRVAGRPLLGRQRVEHRRVADDGRRLVVGAGVVLALADVDAGLAAVGRVDLGDEGRRNLDVAHAALVDRGAEAGEVADDAAAEGEDHVAALGTRAR